MSCRQIVRYLGVLMPLLVLGDVRSPLARAAQTFPTMSTAVDAIATQYKVRVGLELAMSDADRLPISLDLSRPKVAALLHMAGGRRRLQYLSKVRQKTVF